jgi:serine protease Do
MANFRNSVPLIFGFIAMGIIVGVVLTTGFNLDSKSIADQNDPNTIYTESSDSAENPQESSNANNVNSGNGFVDIVKRVKPAIVTIYTTKNVKVPENPWHRFFRGSEDEGQSEGGEREYMQRGLGSGIIVSDDGYILTNHHVIKDVDGLRVQMVDLQEYDAEVVGTDPETEVALIKINAHGLKTAILGNSDNIQIGEWALAIGSPLELNFSVTAGIVSALSRDINIIGRGGGYGIENFIQTDAAINPGNSGGALVNYNGEVIGINTAIKTETGTYIGYGFAIPINIAKTVMDDFIKYGEVRRGYIGVRIESMDPVRAEYYGLDKPQGVFISGVLPGKAADKAGLKPGDIILEVEGMEVDKPNQLQAKVGTFNPGDEISLLLWRDKRKEKFSIVLEGRSEDVVAEKVEQQQTERKVESLGINIKGMTAQELDLYDLENGVLIQSVDQNSPAARQGLRRGDVIFEIDDDEISSISELREYIESRETGSIIKLLTRSRFQDGTTSDRLVFLKITD